MDRNRTQILCPCERKDRVCIYRLHTIALKKMANKTVFEEISTELDEIMSGEDFKED
jgi:hypothetical protein